jgi:prepilin-type N-terminal cleavage/methylation domain-containing protein
MKCNRLQNAFTLLEMTVVIMVLLTLMGTGLFVSNQYSNWQLGRAASEELRAVYSAQRMYLADHPTAIVSDITDAQIIPYLTNRATALPTVESLEGDNLGIIVNVVPPVVDDGSGGVYDPSNSTTDSLWDIGE